VTSTGRSWEDQQQFEILKAPDAARPGFAFRDGEYDVVIQTWPAALPVWLVYSPSNGLGLLDLLWALPLRYVVRRMDDRSKVVTFRQPKRRPSLPRVIGLEFWPTERAADARRVQLLRTWRPGQSTAASPMPPLARGQARRAR
jgi:hypothetical protein